MARLEQLKEFFVYGRSQIVEAAVGKIGPSNTATKQYVAAKDNMWRYRLADEYDVAD